MRMRKKSAPIKFLVPLIYAPVLPLSKFIFPNLIFFSFDDSAVFVDDLYFLFLLVIDYICWTVRLTLRHKPVLRDRLFTAVLAGAFVHGFYLVYPFLLHVCGLISRSIMNSCVLPMWFSVSTWLMLFRVRVRNNDGWTIEIKIFKYNNETALKTHPGVQLVHPLPAKWWTKYSGRCREWSRVCPVVIINPT